ncbi:hypothetical protein [Fluviispira vulneris]|uniref:hypothetical protein n=1 Tax=Fluviispira vulneris TaxID=2763012 RepID=UPI0016443728|nr:hypothetical protein [Fluviispira vulneris]
MKLKIIAATLALLSLNAYAWNYRYNEADKGWIIPYSDSYIGSQSDDWSCGAYAGTKFLNAFGHGVGYRTFKIHYSQKMWGNGVGSAFEIGNELGLSPNRLQQGINFYVAERVASKIKKGILTTQDVKAEVWRDYSTSAIKREVLINKRPAIVLLKKSGLNLHWVTVIGWIESADKAIYADSDGTIRTADFYEFNSMRLNDYSYLAVGIYPKTVITGSIVKFNTLDSFFDTLVSGSEHLNYKVPVLSEVYNLNKLGGETINSILGYGVNDINDTLRNLGIHGLVPDLTIPLSMSDIVKIKNEAKRIVENVANSLGYQHAEKGVKRVNNEIRRFFGWRR